MTIIRQLVTKWGFDVDSKPLAAMEKSIKDLKKGLVVVGTAAAAGAATLFGWAKAAANAGDDAAKTARSLGIEAEAFQELAYAVDLAGVSKEMLGNSLRYVNQNIDDAINGNDKAIKGFRKLGLSVDDLRGKNAEEVLMMMANGFAALPEGADRANLAADMFGRRNGLMLNAVAGGADALRELRLEAIKYGNVIGEESTKKAERFNDALTRIQKLIKGVALMIGVDMVDNTVEAVEALVLWVAESRELIKLRLEQSIQLVVKSLTVLWKWLRATQKAVSNIIDAFGGLGRIARIVGVVMAWLALWKTITMLMAFYKGIMALVAAYKLLGTAATIAKAKVMFLPAVIALLIILIAVAVDDFRGFFAGQDSAIGRLLERYPVLGASILTLVDVVTEVTKSFGDLFEFIATGNSDWDNDVSRLGQSIGDSIYDTVQDYKRWFSELWEWMGKGHDAMVDGIVMALDKIVDKMKEMTGRATDLIKKIPGVETAMEAIGEIRGRRPPSGDGTPFGGAGEVMQHMGAIARADTTGSSMAGNDARGAAARSGNRTYSYQGGEMNITQRPGESGEDFARRVAEIQQKEWDRQMRRTGDDFDMGVVY